MLLKKRRTFRPEEGEAPRLAEKGEGQKEKDKKFIKNFLRLFGMLNNQSAGSKTINFLRKMLDGGVEKAHKAVRANELATSKGRRKKIFPDGVFLTRV